MKQRFVKFFKKFSQALLLVFIVLLVKTIIDFKLPYKDFRSINSDSNNLQILDRDGQPLSFSYQNRWNNYDNIPLHEIPELLQQAFIISEDKRFFRHHGVDWLARSSALWQHMWRDKNSRGASTITEQVVRMLYPQKRSYWSKWIEGLEAIALEMQVGKIDILEFYLNQVPYRSNRRGIVQAARFYFNRDLKTLNTKEILTLVVLVRAPSKFDPYAKKVQINESINRLANALVESKVLDKESFENLKKYDLTLDSSKLPIQAFHFVDYVRRNMKNIPANENKIVTTLNGNLQNFTQELLETRLKSLSSKKINNAAALIVDHQTHEILAWVSVGSNCKKTNNEAAGCKIDMVTVGRQPGSALKPFLYAAALEKGWTAATIIDDSPYSENIGKGIHNFHNYSHTYYGKVSLRNALGNSLNIPALHTANFVTPKKYLAILQDLGFQNLEQSADFYGEGLALGNGEVSLFELVRAYSVFANHGKLEPLKITFYQDFLSKQKQIYSDEIASLIGNILSDPWARGLEFGRTSILNFPAQTAVKTGTSTDYRDAWALGYNNRYVVGVWMGNIDYIPTDGITGSIGPSLSLRSIFNELEKNSDSAPLYLSPKLIAKDICVNIEDRESKNPRCATYTEYFIANSKEESPIKIVQNIEIFRPAQGLEMAIDPRIPLEKQMFEMRVSGILESDEVEWFIDNKKYLKILGSKFLWQIQKGKHSVKAVIWRDQKEFYSTSQNSFTVK